jgi:hypothetical protein
MSVHIDIWLLASIRGEELDDMLLRRDFICGTCGLSKDQHTKSCVVQKLLYTRIRMVPTIINK